MSTRYLASLVIWFLGVMSYVVGSSYPPLSSGDAYLPGALGALLGFGVFFG